VAHETARELLAQARTFLERTRAVEAALSLGMPLHEIEQYLDWLDAVRPMNAPGPPPSRSKEHLSHWTDENLASET
jgi:DNA-binding transcriptional MerR regulator